MFRTCGAQSSLSFISPLINKVSPSRSHRGPLDSLIYGLGLASRLITPPSSCSIKSEQIKMSRDSGGSEGAPNSRCIQGNWEKRVLTTSHELRMRMRGKMVTLQQKAGEAGVVLVEKWRHLVFEMCSFSSYWACGLI